MLFVDRLMIRKLSSQFIFFYIFSAMRKHFHTTILFRLTICALYLLFFAVQLHFRYDSVEVNGTAVLTRGHGNKIVDFSKKYQNAQVENKTSLTRLNKRYFPAHFYLIQTPVVPSRHYCFIAGSTAIHQSPVLLQPHQRFALRRGPPADC